MASDLRVQAELITAIFDLQVVRGIRNAIRVNLLKKGGREGPLGNIENPKPPPSLPNFGEQRHAGASERPTTIGIDATPARPRPVEHGGGCDYRGGVPVDRRRAAPELHDRSHAAPDRRRARQRPPRAARIAARAAVATAAAAPAAGRDSRR